MLLDAEKGLDPVDRHVPEVGRPVYALGGVPWREAERARVGAVLVDLGDRDFSLAAGGQGCQHEAIARLAVHRGLDSRLGLELVDAIRDELGCFLRRVPLEGAEGDLLAVEGHLAEAGEILTVAQGDRTANEFGLRAFGRVQLQGGGGQGGPRRGRPLRARSGRGQGDTLRAEHDGRIRDGAGLTRGGGRA
ncbi:hypothetical protein D3C72_1738220 [compost metagenome]